MSAPVKLTAAQRRALDLMASYPDGGAVVGRSFDDCTIPSSVAESLHRRGFVIRRPPSVVITDAGRAALAASKEEKP